MLWSLGEDASVHVKRTADPRIGRATTLAIVAALVLASCQAVTGSPMPRVTDAAAGTAGDPAGASAGPPESPATTPTIEPTGGATLSPSPTSPSSSSVAPSPTAEMTTESPDVAAGPPPAPSAVTLDTEEAIDDSGLVVRRFTVRWEAPLTPGVTVRVYGVTKCLNQPTDGDVPCVVDGMKLPSSTRTVVARGPATDGTASWTWPLADVDGPVLAWDGKHSYYAFRIAASNTAGRSPFVVVESAMTCVDCMR